MAKKDDKSDLRQISDDELKKVLEDHKKWFESDGEEGKQADLSHTDLSKRDLREANLQEANLEGANLYKAHLEEADLSYAHLEGADLSEAHLEGADLIVANLQEANLRGAYLRGAYLRGAYLRGAYLQEAKFRDANLWGANLQEANLFKASLRGANLQSAVLREAKLQNANFSDAILIQADMRGADLTQAILVEANLEGANITNCIGHLADLKKAHLFVDQIEQLETWGKSIKNKSTISFSFRAGKPTAYPHVLYMMFPGYENLVEILKELEKESPGSWNIMNRPYNDKIVFQVEAISNKLDKLLALGDRTHKKVDMIDSNLPVLVGKVNLTVEQEAQAIKRLIKDEHKSVRELTEILRDLKGKDISNLLRIIEDIYISGLDLSFNDKEALCGLLRSTLDRQKSQPGFLEKLMSAYKNVSISVAAGAGTTALLDPDLFTQASTLAGAGLAGWLLITIAQWLSPEPSTPSDPQSLLGFEENIDEDT